MAYSVGTHVGIDEYVLGILAPFVDVRSLLYD
jgi:hypothetical protein